MLNELLYLEDDIFKRLLRYNTCVRSNIIWTGGCLILPHLEEHNMDLNRHQERIRSLLSSGDGPSDAPPDRRELRRRALETERRIDRAQERIGEHQRRYREDVILLGGLVVLTSFAMVGVVAIVRETGLLAGVLP